MSRWSTWRVRCRRVWSPSPTPLSAPCWGRLAGLAAFCSVCSRSLGAGDGSRVTSCVRSKALRNGCTRSYLVLFNFLFLVCIELYYAVARDKLLGGSSSSNTSDFAANSYTFLRVAWSVCLSSVCHIHAPCLNLSKGDLDAIWQVHLWSPKTACV